MVDPPMSPEVVEDYRTTVRQHQPQADDPRRCATCRAAWQCWYYRTARLRLVEAGHWRD